MATDSSEVLAGFRLIEPAGAGAMGEVWRAEHVQTGSPVAIKRLPNPGGVDGDRLRALQDAELRATALLDHPQIVRIVDTGYESSNTTWQTFGADESFDAEARWMALEWCGGGTLDTALRHARTAWPTLESAVLAVLNALAHAHARDVVHRDVKPGNILRDEAGGWRLADFGVARVERRAVSEIAGSPVYMAPEMFRPDPEVQGAASDLYSLACTVWELVAGQAPFEGTTRELFDQHRHAPLPVLEARFPVPAGLERWMVRLLAKDPDDRPASAAEARFLFENLHRLDQDPVFVPRIPSSRPQQRGRDRRLRDAGISLVAHREPPLLGRDSEVESLWARLNEVRERRTPYVVVLTGPEGVGRTRVARALAREAHARGFGPTAHIRLEGAGLLPLEHGFDGANAAAVRSWSGDRVGVVVLDDLEDPPTARAIADLVVTAGGPVLWLITAGSVPASLVKRLPEEDWEEMALRRSEHVSAILEQTLSLEPALNAKLTREAAGLPGVALARVTEWVEHGGLVPSEGGFQLQSRPREAPRLELPEETERALELAAVAGGRVPVDGWLAAVESVGGRIDGAALSELMASGAARYERVGRERVLVLASGTRLDEWTASGLENAALGPACRALIEALDATDPRRGLLQRALGDPVEAARTLVASAARARRDGDHGYALVLVREALSTCSRTVADEAEARRVTWAGRNLMAALRIEVWQLDGVLRDLMDWESELHLAPVRQRATYWIRRGTVLRYRGRHAAAFEAFDRARAVIERDERRSEGPRLSDAVRSTVLREAASHLVTMGDVQAATPLLERAYELASDDPEVAYACLSLGRVDAFHGRHDAALARYTEGLAAADRAGMAVTSVNLLSMLGEGYSRAGEQDKALYMHQRAVERARDLPGFDGVMLELNLEATQVRRGAFEAVLRRLDELAFDPRVRRLAIGRVGVALLRTAALAGAGEWARFPDAVDDFLGFLEKHDKLMDPDFVAFARDSMKRAEAEGVPDAARAAAREMLEATEARGS